jgi:hypothetical protein
MPKLRIQASSSNEAFCHGNMATEFARILREIASRIEEDGDTEGLCRDINGNSVGSWKVTK